MVNIRYFSNFFMGIFITLKIYIQVRTARINRKTEKRKLDSPKGLQLGKVEAEERNPKGKEKKLAVKQAKRRMEGRKGENR